jgi:hypothetical protein
MRTENTKETWEIPVATHYVPLMKQPISPLPIMILPNLYNILDRTLTQEEGE